MWKDSTRLACQTALRVKQNLGLVQAACGAFRQTALSMVQPHITEIIAREFKPNTKNKAELYSNRVYVKLFAELI